MVWVQLLSIAEEFVTRLSFDDLNNIAKIANPETRKILTAFEKRLREWRISLAPGIMHGMQTFPQAFP